jgi:hypothetical protein
MEARPAPFEGRIAPSWPDRNSPVSGSRHRQPNGTDGSVAAEAAARSDRRLFRIGRLIADRRLPARTGHCACSREGRGWVVTGYGQVGAKRSVSSTSDPAQPHILPVRPRLGCMRLMHAALAGYKCGIEDEMAREHAPAAALRGVHRCAPPAGWRAGETGGRRVAR